MRKLISDRSTLVKCPNCNRLFSKIYARATACNGCNSASLGDCGFIKCPFCGYEFPSNNIYI